MDSDGQRSEGVITRLENFDMNVAQKYLRKDNIRMRGGKSSEVDLDSFQEDYIDDVVSVISRRDDNLMDFFTRDARGGDLSPYRKFKAQFRGRKESEIEPGTRRNDKSAPVNMWGSMRHKKSEMIPRTSWGMDDDRELGGLTMKAAKSHLPEKTPRKISGMGGFSSHLENQANSVPLHIPLGQISEKEEKKKVIICLEYFYRKIHRSYKIRVRAKKM